MPSKRVGAPKQPKARKPDEVLAVIDAMTFILDSVGIPMEGLSARRKEKMAMVMLAIADVSSMGGWAAAKGMAERHGVGTKDAIRFYNRHFCEETSITSYDDVKRKDLVLPENADLVLPTTAKGQAIGTNTPTRKYCLEDHFAQVVRAFGTPQWEEALNQFKQLQPSLKEKLNTARGLERVPVKLPNGQTLVFSPGGHNQLQKAIVEYFLSYFVPQAEVLYIGDSVVRDLYRLDARLEDLGFTELAHGDLPDVVVYDPVRDCIFIIEAVHSVGIIHDMRIREIKRLMSGCSKDVVYVTAFPDRKAFQSNAGKIAWETEVWIADNPEHMIHYNGDKFLGPHKPGVQSTVRRGGSPEPVSFP